MRTTFRAPDVDDPTFISGEEVVAVIQNGGMCMYLTKEMMADLFDDVKEYFNTTFCHQCKNYIESSSGLEYGGSCILKAAKDGNEITKENAGYNYPVGRWDKCKSAKRREV